MEAQNLFRGGVADLAQTVEGGVEVYVLGGLIVEALSTRLDPALLVIELRFQFMSTSFKRKSSAAANKSAAASGSSTF